MSSVVVTLGVILAAVAVKLIADDCKAWTPRIVNYFLQRAILRLPNRQRERFDEEWRSHADEIPGVIGKLIFAFSLQIAAREMARSELRRRKHFDLIWNPEGILYFDRELRITGWNPMMERISGMTVDDVLGRRFFDVLPHLVGTKAEAALRGTLDGRDTMLYEMRYIVAPSRRESYCDAFFAPYWTSDGKISRGGIGFLRDIDTRERSGSRE